MKLTTSLRLVFAVFIAAATIQACGSSDDGSGTQPSTNGGSAGTGGGSSTGGSSSGGSMGSGGSKSTGGSIGTGAGPSTGSGGKSNKDAG